MLKRNDFAEKRQFGRRPANIRAWIRVSGRPPVPCVLSNVSEGGALLNLDRDFWLPYSFRLTSEDKTIDRIVEVRHQQPRRIGVEFVAKAVSEDQLKQIAKRISDFDDWAGAASLSR